MNPTTGSFYLGAKSIAQRFRKVHRGSPQLRSRRSAQVSERFQRRWKQIGKRRHERRRGLAHIPHPAGDGHLGQLQKGSLKVLGDSVIQFQDPRREVLLLQTGEFKEARCSEHDAREQTQLDVL